jgi:hypothetical protein
MLGDAQNAFSSARYSQTGSAGQGAGSISLGVINQSA